MLPWVDQFKVLNPTVNLTQLLQINFNGGLEAITHAPDTMEQSDFLTFIGAGV